MRYIHEPERTLIHTPSKLHIFRGLNNLFNQSYWRNWREQEGYYTVNHYPELDILLDIEDARNRVVINE